MSIQKITWSFNDVVYGEPWYWKSVSEVFETLTVEHLNFKIEGVHSIPEIIEHMIAWRKFAIEQINGNVDYEIKLDSTRDWSAIETVDQALFDDLKQSYFLSQKTLLSLIQAKSNEWLKDKIPARKYNFEFLLEGVIQHDIYHLGQIAMLKSACDKANS